MIWFTAVLAAAGLVLLFLAYIGVVSARKQPQELTGTLDVPDKRTSQASASRTLHQEEMLDSGIDAERDRVDPLPNEESRQKDDTDNVILEHKSRIISEIELALAGSIEDASRVVEYVSGCSEVEPDDSALRVLLDATLRNPDMPMRMPIGILGPSQDYGSYEEWSAARMRRFKECHATENLFGESFHARLRMKAENGDVLARFLYAMLPPKYRRGDRDWIIDWLEYTKLAYEFTVQNMNEGEPLGLLAYGLSLRGLGRFTPRESGIGNAFLLAAERCGAPQVFLDKIALPTTESAIATSWFHSEAIVKEYCP
jgi:hypothetical protein